MSAIVRNPNALPVGRYFRPFDRRMRPVSEAGYTPSDDLAELDDLVNANIRQMAGPINQTNEE